MESTAEYFGYISNNNLGLIPCSKKVCILQIDLRKLGGEIGMTIEYIILHGKGRTTDVARLGFGKSELMMLIR